MLVSLLCGVLRVACSFAFVVCWFSLARLSFGCWLFVVRYTLCVVRCALFDVWCCWLFVRCWLSVVVCCLLCVLFVCCLLYVVCLLLCVC